MNLAEGQELTLICSDDRVPSRKAYGSGLQSRSGRDFSVLILLNIEVFSSARQQSLLLQEDN